MQMRNNNPFEAHFKTFYNAIFNCSRNKMKIHHQSKQKKRTVKPCFRLATNNHIKGTSWKTIYNPTTPLGAKFLSPKHNKKTPAGPIVIFIKMQLKNNIVLFVYPHMSTTSFTIHTHIIARHWYVIQFIILDLVE